MMVRRRPQSDPLPNGQREIKAGRELSERASVWLLLILGVVLTLGAAGRNAISGSTALPQGLTEVSPPMPMPAFRLPAVDGTAVDAVDLRGKVVVIRFWATW